MKKTAGTAILLALLTLTACGQTKEGAQTRETATPKQSMTGSDRDAHSCIGSAGYRWCERIDKCVRPWELAKQAGFDKTQEAFDAYCKNR